MNNLRIFENERLGKIRVLEIDNEPWFVGKDVAEILGYTNNRKAIIDHVDNEDKTDGVTIRDSIGRKQRPTLINESGLYSLILSSKLSTAKDFKRWVTSEVLPAIRKTGGYIPTSPEMSEAEIMAKAMCIATKTLEQQKKLIESQQHLLDSQKSKVMFADSLSASDGSITIGAFAKILQQNGIETGQKRLFKYLRDKGYLIKQKCSDKNSPTQKAIEKKLFEVIEKTYFTPDGSIGLSMVTKITTKGQEFFLKEFGVIE